ncbi:transmembrane protein 65 isoform X3 [Sminthopsis crassicaudata]|uniref:transmembrane protein 65 isoform X3 n=1 Tax=Sminthopsis crassicaudata TaxID=9301 RepID=UPI003D693C25
MSRLLLPLLRSRTAHSLRPLPGCRPRGAAGAPALLLRPPPALAAAAAGPLPSRGLGTHPKREPIESLNTAQGARDFIYSLHSTERSCLLKELHRFESIAIAQASRYPKPEIALIQRVKQATSTESPPSFGIVNLLIFKFDRCWYMANYKSDKVLCLFGRECFGNNEKVCILVYLKFYVFNIYNGYILNFHYNYLIYFVDD